MNFKDLQTKLSDLEVTLHKFSYERLNASEAQELKKIFERFSTELHDKIQQESDEASIKEQKTVHKIEEENIESKADTTKDPSQKEILALSLATNRFNAYLKESALSERQLAYINAILAATEIDTRVTNDHSVPEVSSSYRDTDKNSSYKNLKTKAMSSADKRTSEIKKNTKLVNKELSKLDLKPLLEDCLGKKDLLEELIRLYKLNALEFIGQVKIHLQNLDYEAIRFASHKIKSGLRMMNTPYLLALAEQIEIGSKTDRDIKRLKSLFDCFVKEYPVIERAIDDEFKKLN